MAEAGTLNLDFGVKKCPNRKLFLGRLFLFYGVTKPENTL